MVHAPVVVGARVVPRSEHRADRAPQLRLDVLGERLARDLADLRLEQPDGLAQRGLVEVLVAVRLVRALDVVEDDVERRFVVLVARDHAEDNLAVHRDEPAVAIPREARVAARGGERGDGGVVEPEVQDRIHHAGHRRGRAAAHADEQRRLAVAELRLGQLLDPRERDVDLGRELGGIRAVAVLHHVPAHLVVIVKPGGTGKPSDAISARFAPLPPRRALSLARPSAVPPPNCRTWFTRMLPCSVSEVADLRERRVNRTQQREPVLAQRRVRIHDHHAALVEERGELRPDLGEDAERIGVLLARDQVVDARGARAMRGVQLLLDRGDQLALVRRGLRAEALRGRLVEDVADALEHGLRVRGQHRQRIRAAARVVRVIEAGAERDLDDRRVEALFIDQEPAQALADEVEQLLARVGRQLDRRTGVDVFGRVEHELQAREQLLVAQEDFQHAERGAAQAQRIGVAAGHKPGREASDQRVHAIRDADVRGVFARRQRGALALRPPVLLDRVADRRWLAEYARVVPAHRALQLGKLADRMRREIRLAQPRRANRDRARGQVRHQLDEPADLVADRLRAIAELRLEHDRVELGVPRIERMTRGVLREEEPRIREPRCEHGLVAARDDRRICTIVAITVANRGASLPSLVSIAK